MAQFFNRDAISRMGVGLETGVNRVLQGDNDIQYLFISIYRCKFKTNDRLRLMKEIIYHTRPNNEIQTEIEIVGRFTTITSNKILGLQVEDASIYGSKIEMSLEDFDFELSKKIKQHDIITIHRINKKDLKIIDALASVIGLGSATSSGINDANRINFKGRLSPLNDFPAPGDRVTNKLVSKFLQNETPIFSGLITNPRLVIGNSVKIAIEAQDMIRILQHINTEAQDRHEYKNIPTNIDEFFVNLNSKDDEFKVKGDDSIQIITSTLLNTLSQAFKDELNSYANYNDAKNKKIVFLKSNERLSIDITNKLRKHYDWIFIKPISNTMFLVHIAPIRAIKLFVEFYTKNTGVDVFFDFDMWEPESDNFYQNSSIVEDIYKKIFKGSVGVNPFFTFGMTLDTDDQIPISEDAFTLKYGDSLIDNPDSLFILFKRYIIDHTFTDKTFGTLRKFGITESIVFDTINGNDVSTASELSTDFFLHLVDFRERSPFDKDSYSMKHDTNEKMRVIKKEARENYNRKIQELQEEFSNTISLNYIVSTNFSSVRSTEYTPLLHDKLKTVPITQVVQLFLGALTIIPISQSNQTTGFDNSAHNISQRIWLSSAIGFRKKKNDDTYDRSWYHKKGMKPTIFFGLRYNPAYADVDNPKTLATYVPLKDIIDVQMNGLPQDGSLSIYSGDGIHIGYSRFEDGDHSGTSNLSLGTTNNFNLKTIVGSDTPYISDNVDPQVSANTIGSTKNFPRVALGYLVKDGTSATATSSLRKFDDFGIIPDTGNNFIFYVGYDLYALKNIDGGNIALTPPEDFTLYLPVSNERKGILTKAGSFRTLGTAVINNPLNFPEDNIGKIGDGDDKYLVTGIRDFYDPTSFIPILKLYKHFIEHGFADVNGLGDQNIYAAKQLFIIYHNIKFGTHYLELNQEGSEDIVREITLKNMVILLLEWLKRFEGNEATKRYMMVKYANEISKIKVNNIIGGQGDGKPFIQTNDLSFFDPPSLLSQIEYSILSNPKAKLTITILAGFVRSLAHYMNRVGKESTTGGVIYMPTQTDQNGEILKVGDAIIFQDPYPDDKDLVPTLVRKLKQITLKETVRSDLDLYKKTYYIWKIVYYFGGAGTDPQGTSGNTMRIYLTDSGIHWQSSFEEKDITTMIAEKMQLSRVIQL